MVEYRIDVRPILEEIGASIDIVDALDLGELTVGDEVFALNNPAAFRLTITNAGAGVVAHGSIDAEVTASCSRCLCEFDQVIRGEVVGFYARPDDEAADVEDAEILDVESGVDLGPALMAALVIEAPFAPLHDESCAGLCAKCGADLNSGPCGCDVATDEEHPFSGLSDLLGESPEKSPRTEVNEDR